MKKSKKALSFLLALSTLMLTACGNSGNTSSTSSTASTGSSGSQSSTPESKYPDYLNMDSTTPLVKEGQSPITLKVLTGRVDANSTTNISEVQWIPFAEKLLNVKFEFEDAHENAAERISLMFSTNDLPDMCWALGVTTNQMVTYGQGEKMLLNFTDYLNEELMPNAYACMQEEENKNAFSACKLNDGSMYTLPGLHSTNYLDNSTLANHRVFINKNWMEGAGYKEAPTTLDGFVQMLRDFKEKDPMKQGTANVPYLGVTSLVYDYLWNALGFIGGGGEGYTAALYNNQVQIPCNTEQYRDFVTTLNTMYTEGLISPDFFTVDDTTTRAYIVEGNCGVMADWAPFLSCPDSFKEWISVSPLTSKYQPTAKVAKAQDFSVGNVFASSATKYPEVVARFFDYLYTPDGFTNFMTGPMIGQSDAVEGTWEVIQGSDGKWEFNYPKVNDGTYTNSYELKYQIGAVAQHMSGNGRGNKGVEIISGHTVEQKLDMENPDTFYRFTVDEAFGDHLTNDTLPPVYMDESTSNREVDLRTILQNYVKQETAKFITGTRSLTELDAYYEELKKLGIEEYTQIYVDAYSGFVSTLQ